MSMAERKTQSRAVKNPVRRKLTRAEKKEIAAVIQAAKGDRKPRTAQQTIPLLANVPGRDLQGNGKEILKKHSL